MHIPASLHATDVLYGLAVGTGATGLALTWQWRRAQDDASRHRITAATVAFAAIAGLVSMYSARAVRDGLVTDVSTGPAIAVGAVGFLAGLGWTWLSRLLAPVWMAVLVMLSTAGVWATVPDTETAVALLAAWLPFTLWAVARGRSTPNLSAFELPMVAAWCGLAVVLAWAAAWGAWAEASSLPGALACFGVALVAPWVITMVRGELRVAWLVPAQLVAVIVSSRWAADAPTTAGGVARSLAVLALLAGVVAVSARLVAPARRPPSDPPVRPR